MTPTESGAHRTAPAGVTTLLVIAKEPLPGRVKTRLTPPFSPVEAARLAEAALADTLRTVRVLPAARRAVVLDGSPGRGCRPGSRWWRRAREDSTNGSPPRSAPARGRPC